jgi:hypothetical protein
MSIETIDLRRGRQTARRSAALCFAAVLSIAGCSSDKKSMQGNADQAAGTAAGMSNEAGTTAAAGKATDSAGVAALSGGASGSAHSTAGADGKAVAGATAGRAAAGSGGSTSAGEGGMSAGAGTHAAAGGGSSGSGCTRELLSATVDAYFTAIAAHDSSSLPLADKVKFTENGKMLQLTDGAWKTAGKVKFKHSALDTELCTSVTESVLPDGSTDIPYGLRLKLEDQKLTEIESIAVRSGDYFTKSDTMAITAQGSADWEMILPAAQQPTRDALTAIVDKYFTQFPAGACNFASDCKRLENGFSPGSCTAGLSCSMSMGMGMGSMGMKTRLVVLDVEMGVAVGFVMFAGSYTDFHMFRVRDGQVHAVHAILAKASSSGWN